MADSGEASFNEIVLNGLLGRAFASGFASVTTSDVNTTCATYQSRGLENKSGLICEDHSRRRGAYLVLDQNRRPFGEDVPEDFLLRFALGSESTTQTP